MAPQQASRFDIIKTENGQNSLVINIDKSYRDIPMLRVVDITNKSKGDLYRAIEHKDIEIVKRNIIDLSFIHTFKEKDQIYKNFGDAVTFENRYYIVIGVGTIEKFKFDYVRLLDIFNTSIYSEIRMIKAANVVTVKKDIFNISDLLQLNIEK